MGNLSNVDTLRTIKEVLEEILGENGLNTLGKYDVYEGNTIVTQIPSIKIRYANERNPLITKMVNYSGIDVQIWEQPDIVPQFYLNQQSSFQNYYTISLDDYHPYNGLKESCYEIVTCPAFLCDQQSLPPIKNAVVSAEKFEPARALVYIYTVTVLSPYIN